MPDPEIATPLSVFCECCVALKQEFTERFRVASTELVGGNVAVISELALLCSYAAAQPVVVLVMFVVEMAIPIGQAEGPWSEVDGESIR